VNWRSRIFVSCVGSLIMGLPAQFSLKKTMAEVKHPGQVMEQHSPQLSIAQLRQLAESITVKIPANVSWGSGILIEKQGKSYTVLTNHHVIKDEVSYKIQTLDGQIHPGILIRKVHLDGYDLALLSFVSERSYTVAKLGHSSSLKPGEDLFAAGFPFDSELTGSRGFIFTTGQVSWISSKTFAGGYQIGYTNPIEKGMSGGPVLNRNGEVVGVNGLHAYPLWGNPYVFQDGSIASAAMQQQMSQYSWAIPIDTLTHAGSNFNPNSALPIPQSNPVSLPNSPQQMTPRQGETQPSNSVLSPLW
jgi:serine protease Do